MHCVADRPRGTSSYGRWQMIVPAYSLPAGIDSVLVTMHLPIFVSIGSPGWGGVGSSTLSRSSKVPAWIMMR